MEDREREEHPHQEVMNFAEILGVDQLRQPADELGQDRVAKHPAVKSQASQNLHQHQQVDDEVG